MIIFLYILGPILALLYKSLDYFGYIDKWIGIFHAKKGLKRLLSGAGYPVTFLRAWVDKKELEQISRLIVKYCQEPECISKINQGGFPGLIATVGSPNLITGLDPKWGLDVSRYYSESHPIMVVFDVTAANPHGKGYRCGSIRDLMEWINNEKKLWDYFIGTVILLIFSIASILLRLELLEK